MQLTYTKISENLYKFFYEADGYGEFYIRLEKDGTASLERKDYDYGESLIKGFTKELVKE